jgi:hypothetical protein
MAYLDWSNTEDAQIDAQVIAAEMGDNPFGNYRRGVDEIWRRAERDFEEQEALYSAADRQERPCIVVELE